jgi:hypothetical protein
MADGDYRPMTARDLYDHISRFADDNASSRDVDMRWLASKMEAWRPLVADVMNSRLGPAERVEVNVFRAAEIEKELEVKRREVNILERSLQQIKAA